MLDINNIISILPHRYPLLLVDRIEELIPGERVVGIKNVTINEEFFQGHYPGHPIMPGVLIIEAMAQVGGLLMLHSFDEPENKLPFFAGIDNARFRRPVVPGDRIIIEAELIKLKGRISKVRAISYVEGEIAAEANLMFAIEDK
jgi:3-hydroxyacyl-[acyl-carrier-protein] dehydratase